MTTEYDAIFVGGGHNALAAAIILSRKGWTVGIFEISPVVGGSVQTRELTLPGFRHDVAAMNLSLFAGSSFHQEFAGELSEHGLEFVPVSNCFASVFPDGKWVGISSDIEISCTCIEKFSKADSQRWRTMVARFGDIAPHLFGMLGSPMSLWSLTKSAFKAWRFGGFKFVAEMAKLLLSSPRKFLNENFESTELKVALASWGMHLDFPPDQAGGAMFPYLEGMANQSFGMVLGKNGADTMIKAMVDMAQASGCRIHTNSEVVEILTSNQNATGIKLVDGSVFKSKNAVVTSVAPANLCSKLLSNGSGDKNFDDAMTKFEHAPGTMMIHLALDSKPQWQAGKELGTFAYVHIAPTMRTMAEAYAQAMDGLLPVAPVIVVGQPTAIDPERAPENKHILWVQVRVLPANIKGDAKDEIDGRDWDDIKEQYCERVLDILESYAPGTRSKIIGKAVFSPLDLQRENPNLVGGDQICGSHHLTQNFLFRPAFGWSDWKTPIKNLYQIGASTWPGAGVGAGSGTMLAHRLAGKRR
ncbi:MAG: NAD(P)/FAD-dependent oxidoreductase [Rhizobiaceae bacterium]|nr:NAD(P)/FAD-dependent oxidoreductase [Rhizobiaceae bacterium]